MPGTLDKGATDETIAKFAEEYREAKEKDDEPSIPYPGMISSLCTLALVSQFYRKRRD